MSYTFYSFRDPSGQNREQWATRTVQGEIESIRTRSLADIFRQHLTGKNLKIIEAGCGLGGWLPFFEKMGHSVIGIEYEADVVERVKAFDPDIPIEQGDVTRLNFPDDTFDVYVSLGVIEHFKNGPEKALSEAFRVLKPGGSAFISVPYLSPFRRWFAHPLRGIYFFLHRLKGGRKYFWEYRYSYKELSNFIKNAGFDITASTIDDYRQEDTRHHIGLYADFFFLRRRGGDVWELNTIGRLLLKFARRLSPWLFCSGLLIIARKGQSRLTHET